jgi:hypothetical protein
VVVFGWCEDEDDEPGEEEEEKIPRVLDILLERADRSHVKKLLTLFGALLLAVTPAIAAHIPLYDLPDVEVAPDSSVWSDSYVDGVSIRIKWKDFETSDGTYDTSFLVPILQNCQTYGKKMLLRILTEGSNAPGWVMNISTKFINPDSETIWVYWDTNPLSKISGLMAEISSLNSTYGSVISIVSVGLDSQGTGDWDCPHSTSDIATWNTLGYTSTLNVNGCQSYVNRSEKYSWSTYFSSGRNGSLDSTQSYVAQTVADWGVRNYHRYFIVGKNSWSAFMPDPNSSCIGTQWEVMYNALSDTGVVEGCQALWWVYGDTQYKDNNGTPASYSSILAAMFTKAHTWGLSDVEVYEVDVRNLGSTIQANN